MEYIYETIKSAIIVAISVIVILLMSRSGVFSIHQDVYTIDMNKVLRAHQALVVDAAMNKFDAALNLKGTSKKVDAAIKNVAGSHVVLIAPVVASELSNDITDLVILELGLELPKSGVTYIDSDVFPDISKVKDADPDEFLKKYSKLLEQKALDEKAEEDKRKVEAIIPK